MGRFLLRHMLLWIVCIVLAHLVVVVLPDLLQESLR